MEEVLETQDKFKKVLSGFLHANYTTTNDVYLEMLLTHLSDKKYSGILQSAFVLDWIDQCLNILSNDYSQLKHQVIALMLRISALVTGNEWNLVQLREKHIPDRIQKIIETNRQQLSPLVKFGHVQFLKAIARYSVGLRWVTNSKAILHLIYYCHENQTAYVTKESRNLIYEILYKNFTKANDEELCLEILSEITKPLLDNIFSEDTTAVRVDDSAIQRKLGPALDLISCILEKTLESEEKTKLAHFMATKFNLEINLWKLTEMTQNQYFLGKILHAMTSFNFALLVYEKWTNGKIASADFNQFGVNFFNHMKFCVTRRSCHNIIKLAELNHRLWKKLGPRAPEEIMIDDEKIQFENQLITFHLLPVLFMLRSRTHLKQELFDNYIMKLFTISCEFTLRICYAFRDVLFECPEIAADLSYKSLQGILSMENVLNQDRAVLVFQGMIYALKEFANDDHETSSESVTDGTADTDLLVKIPNVLYAVLVGLYTLIKRYKLTWKDSIETICLLNFVLTLLKNKNLTTRLAVQSIKLTQLSIEHYLSPNLALLMNHLNGSGMQNLGPMIMKRLHDTEWEVRDSTLELVTSIVEISRLKFPAFQQYILDQGICPVVFSMTKHDMESYVRASALKCLSEMVAIRLLWEKSLCHLDLIGHLLLLIPSETEGIVRKEAVAAITKIYDLRSISVDKKNALYSTLTHCAVNDLHWEVKINALKFFQRVTCHQFTNQGMIDGTFPNVTFSKEHKKIVTLTSKEIFIRIEKILNELSLIGCLGVILKCLSDECDLEVVKKATIIVGKLFEYLNRYEYRQQSVNSPVSNNTELMNTTNTEQMNGDASLIERNEMMIESDNVIEGIVTDQDMNLLIATYENQMQVDSPSYENKIDENYYKKFANVTPSQFLNKINTTDLEALVEERNNWFTNTESFDSLLDDMLFSIKTIDVNNADCY